MIRNEIAGQRHLVMLAPVIALFLVCATIFARVQNVWVDETTQLSGATLAPGQLYEWLTGAVKIPFGVPPDRMPPFSYLLDMIGWRIWGNNELAFRLYHAVIVAGGLMILMVAVARRFSLRAALILGLILALSPKLLETSVEIRAYPIFFALSCAQIAMLVRGGISESVRRSVLFFLVGLLSGFTHFFGVVATSAYVLAAFIAAPNWRSAIRIVVGYVILLFFWTGLAPFVFGASAISNPEEAISIGIGTIVTFFVQLIGTGVIMVKPLVAALYFGGIGLLLVLGGIGLGAVVLRKRADARHDPALGVLVALSAGILVTIAVAFVLKGFNPLSARYNIWMLPAVALLLALAADGVIAPTGKLARAARFGGLALLLAGTAWAQTLFLSRAEWFVHAPSRTLEAIIAKTTGPRAIVHVGDWGWGYFPLYRNHRDTLRQWLLTDDGRAVIPIDSDGYANGKPHPLSVLDDNRTVIVSRVKLNTYKDLRLIDQGRAPPVSDLPLVPALNEAGWTKGETIYRPGNYNFTGQIYSRDRNHQ